MADRPTLPGALRDRYRVTRVLGAGGFGTVLQAEDLEMGRPVAIKLLHDQLADPETRHRFRREARVTADLRHPHVVPVHDFGDEDERAFIIYAFVPGRALSSWIGAPPEPGLLVTWAAQLADALQAAHAAGVLHRDLKPDNILIREDGGAVLCDFGVARSRRDGTMVTPTGLILGTPDYMAPEVLMGGAPGPASDQFGLAASLAHVWTGAGVYGERDLAGIFDLVRRGSLGPRPPWPSPAPPELARFLDRALAFDPEARFPGMAEAVQVLRGRPCGPAPSTHPTVVRAAVSAPEAPAEPRRPGRAGLALGAVGILLLAGLAARSLEPPAPNPLRPPEARGPDPDPEELWRVVEARMEDLRAGHADPTGKPLPLSAAHVEVEAEDLGRHDLVRRICDLYRAATAWLRAPRHDGDSRDDRLFQVLGWLDHMLGDVENLTARGDVDLARDAAQRPQQVDRWMANRDSLVQHATGFWSDDLAPGDGGLLLMSPFMARLPIPGKLSYLEEVVAQAEARRDASLASLVAQVRHALTATRTSRDIDRGTRMRLLRRVLAIQREQGEPTAIAWTVYGYLRLGHSAIGEADDEPDAGIEEMADAVEEQVARGRVSELRAIVLVDNGKYLDENLSMSLVPRRPRWRAAVARIRRLLGVDGP